MSNIKVQSSKEIQNPNFNFFDIESFGILLTFEL